MRRSLQLAALTVLLGFVSFAPVGAQPRPFPRQAWVFDDAVDESRREGNRLFVGGSFRTAAPQANDSRGFAELTPNSASPSRPFPRLSDGGVLALADDGAGGWFVGGTFSAVEGIARPYLAHYAASGALDAAFAPAPNGPVRALLRVGATLYVGGDFTAIGGAARGRAAAFALGAGTLAAWNPQVADGAVHALATDATRIFLGGDFTTVGGAARVDLAAVDPATGAPDAFTAPTDGTVRALLAAGSRLLVGGSFATLAGASRANLGAVAPSTGAIDALNVGTNGPVLALAAAPGGIYLGGAFTTVGGQPRRGLAALDETGALRSWVADVNGTVQSLGATTSGIVAGGLFTRLNGEARANIAAVATSGALLPWNPGLNGQVDAVVGLADGRVAAGGAFTHFGARVREGLAAVDVVTDELLPLSPTLNGTVTALALAGRTLYVGGTFTQADGAPRGRLAAFDTTSYALLAWAPDANDAVEALEAAGGAIYAGGRFTTIGGAARAGLAGLDPATGALTAWNAGFAGTGVNELEAAGSTLYVGGAFGQLGGQPRANFGAFDLGSGAITSLAPTVSGAVWGLSVTSARVYFAGEFTAVNGQPRQGMAAVDRATGALTGFDPVVIPGAPASAVYDIDVRDRFAFVAGRFNDLNCCERHGFAVIESNEGRSTEDSNTPWPRPLPPPTTVGRHVAYYGDLLVLGGLVPPAGTDRQQGLYLVPDFSSVGAPGPPSLPVARITGDTLQMRWTASPIGGNHSDFVVEAALAPGAPAFASIPNGNYEGTFSIGGVPPGLYFVRVRARNGDGLSAPSPEVGLVFGNGCSAPPLPPDPKAVVTGSSVALTWQAGTGFVSNYRLLVGTQAGLANILTTDLGGVTSLGAAAGPGTYHVRLVAQGPCGVSGPSGNLPVVIGGVAPPATPVAQAQVAGGTVTVTWDAVAGATGYRLVAGTGPLLANITTFDTTGTALVAPGVPPGVYYVRVYAIGAGGPSEPSRELQIIVP